MNLLYRFPFVGIFLCVHTIKLIRLNVIVILKNLKKENNMQLLSKDDADEMKDIKIDQKIIVKITEDRENHLKLILSFKDHDKSKVNHKRKTIHKPNPKFKNASKMKMLKLFSSKWFTVVYIGIFILSWIFVQTLFISLYSLFNNRVCTYLFDGVNSIIGLNIINGFLYIIMFLQLFTFLSYYIITNIKNTGFSLKSCFSKVNPLYFIKEQIILTFYAFIVILARLIEVGISSQNNINLSYVKIIVDEIFTGFESISILFIIVVIPVMTTVVEIIRPHKKVHSNPIYQNELNTILNDKEKLRAFKDFASSEYSLENVLFFLEIKKYNSISNRKTKLRTAKKIYNTYVKDNGNIQVNLPGDVKKEIKHLLKLIMEDKCDNSVLNKLFESAKQEVSLNLNDTLYRFIATKRYKDIMANKLNNNN